jgi:small subunit ribosomal protein S1
VETVSEPPRESKPKPAVEAQGRRLRRLIDEDLGDELEAALAGFDPAQTLDTKRGAESAEPGKDEKRSYRVLDVRGNDVFVELGAKSEGLIPGLQFEGELPKPGDMIDAVIDRNADANDGIVRLRLPTAAQTADWSTVAKGMIVDAQIKKVNKGGLEVLVNGLRGFMPAGQASLTHLPDLAVLVNQTLRCEVTEANPSERNLVVSRKIIEQRERDEAAEKLWATLAEGQTKEGVVKRLQDFGAFVDIGGVDGLLPISQMSWQRIKHPGDVLQVGQQVKVQIARLDRETKRISLSLKSLSESPWTKAAETYTTGKIVSGVVSKLMEFGAFVELEPAIEGLIHISELSPNRVRRVNDVVQPGQQVEVKVLGCDVENKRISLSLKQALPEPEPAPPSDAETPVAPVADLAPEPDPPAKPTKAPFKPLKGGLGGSGGPLFG